MGWRGGQSREGQLTSRQETLLEGPPRLCHPLGVRLSQGSPPPGLKPHKAPKETGEGPPGQEAARSLPAVVSLTWAIPWITSSLTSVLFRERSGRAPSVTSHRPFPVKRSLRCLVLELGV